MSVPNIWLVPDQRTVLFVPGNMGPAGPPGVPGLVWRSAWSSGTAYAVGDAVSYGATSYISILAGTNHQPDISPTYWNVLAQGSTSFVSQNKWETD